MAGMLRQKALYTVCSRSAQERRREGGGQRSSYVYRQDAAVQWLAYRLVWPALPWPDSPQPRSMSNARAVRHSLQASGSVSGESFHVVRQARLMLGKLQCTQLCVEAPTSSTSLTVPIDQRRPLCDGLLSSRESRQTSRRIPCLPTPPAFHDRHAHRIAPHNIT